MRKKKCALLFVSCSLIYAQQVSWQKDISTGRQDFLSQVVTTIDQNYLVIGSSIVKDNAELAYDYRIVKLSPQGEQRWERTFGGTMHDYLTTAIASQDGSFLLAGNSYSSKSRDKKDVNKGGSDIWVVKVDENGKEEWQKSFGTAKNDEVQAVVQTTSLGYVIAANLQNHKDGFGSKDIWIIYIDKDGKELSHLVLGGRSEDVVKRMIPTKDGGVLLGINSRSDKLENVKAKNTSLNIGEKKLKPTLISKRTESYGESDYWLVKLDNDGVVEWQRSYGGKGEDQLKTLALTTSGFIVGGESQSKRSGNKKVDGDGLSNLWVLSLDYNGNELWQKSYSFGNRDVLKGLQVVSNAQDSFTKGFLLGGYSETSENKLPDDETFWMLYIDDKGNEVWRKHIKGISKKEEERLNDIKLYKDGSIILAGSSTDKLGREGWKIVKLQDSDLQEIVEQLPIKIYPNPVQDYCYVEIGFDFKKADILIYDMGGRLLQMVSVNDKITKLDTKLLVQGAYLVVVKNDQIKVSSKIIKN